VFRNRIRNLVVALLGTMLGCVVGGALWSPAFALNKCGRSCNSASTDCCSDSYRNYVECITCCENMWGAYAAFTCQNQDKSAACREACSDWW